MKVTQNPGSQAQALEQAKSTEKADKAKAARQSDAAATSGVSAKAPREAVEISDGARLLQRANELAHASPDVRADRVAVLKQEIKDGRYRVDSASIADKLVDEHLFGSFGKNDL